MIKTLPGILNLFTHGWKNRVVRHFLQQKDMGTQDKVPLLGTWNIRRFLFLSTRSENEGESKPLVNYNEETLSRRTTEWGSIFQKVKVDINQSRQIVVARTSTKEMRLLMNVQYISFQRISWRVIPKVGSNFFVHTFSGLKLLIPFLRLPWITDIQPFPFQIYVLIPNLIRITLHKL